MDQVLARVLARTEIGDCWLWTGCVSVAGYGMVRVGGRAGYTASAHRLVWELLVGPISPRLELDHLCRVRACVNPDHLEPVTRTENIRRAFAWAEARTVCKWGHRLTPDNLYLYDPARRPRCRRCLRGERRAAA